MGSEVVRVQGVGAVRERVVARWDDCENSGLLYSWQTLVAKLEFPTVETCEEERHRKENFTSCLTRRPSLSFPQTTDLNTQIENPDDHPPNYTLDPLATTAYNPSPHASSSHFPPEYPA